MSSANTRSIGPLDPDGAAPPPLQPGDLVAGRYEVLRHLGSGGSAFVYAVHDRRIGDEIALKLLRDGRRSDIDIARSRREAEFARGSASPRLVRTFDLVEVDGLVFLTMELVSGGSLRDLLRRGALPVDEAVRLACEILEALADLHRLDIVHRDLKPGNLLLTPDGHIKLSDFGIARKWTDEDSRLTSTGLPVGTVDYLSPEQAAAEDVDPRSDLYAFGVVLYEMLTGRVPFEAPSAVGSIVMRLHRRAQDVRKLRPEVPRWLAAVVARLLETKKEDRYDSAEAVLHDLRRRRARSARHLRGSAAALVVLLVLCAGAWWWIRLPDLRFVQEGEWGIRAVTRKGDIVWRRADTSPAHTALLRRGARKELVAILAPSSGTLRSESTRRLSFLDVRTGALLRDRPVPSPAKLWFPQHPDRFGVVQVLAKDLNRDWYDEAVVAYSHHYWPSFTIVHDLSRDTSAPVFVASGHHTVEATADVDGDGVEELILVGTANRQGWYTGVTAVRVLFGAAPDEMVGFTPDLEEVRSRSVLWYALAPPGGLRIAGVTTDRVRRVIRLDYGDGRRFELTFDGFAPALRSPLSVPDRQTARERAYVHVRAAVRLTASGFTEDAIAEADTAWASARRAGDAMLAEWSGRRKGVALIQAGRFDEAHALFEQLAANSPAASEVAWDAANAYHLRGELRRALAWYRRNLGREGQPGVGRLKYETIQGLVLALGEMNRWTEARTEVERFAAYPEWADDWKQELGYISWRTAGRPPDRYDPNQGIDVYRYWPLEFALARNEDPERLLRMIESDRTLTFETPNLLLMTRAEALRRLGRIDDAYEAAREGFDRLHAERRTSVLARAHFDLAAERLATLAEAKGLHHEAKQARAEAAAVRWHPNGIAR